ncbi:MAG: hypothetical protein V7637_4483 [Mycobacteriales bacterium]
MVSRNRNLDKRPNWFDRQFVRAQDFADGDDYALDRRRRHVRLLHTPGVAEGLLVSGVAGDTAVTVAAGTAVDALGREVVVLSPPAPLALPAGPERAEVYLVYDEFPDDPSTDPGVEGYTRIREVASLALRALSADGDDPVPESRGDRPVRGVLLAALSLKDGALRTAPDNGVRTVAGAVIGTAAVDGISLRRPDRPDLATDDLPRISAAAGTGDILLLAGSPPTERMRVTAAGPVAVGTGTPLPGALTVADPSVPLSLRQTGGPAVGGAWRARLDAGTLNLDANTADAGDFSTAATLLSLRPLGNPQNPSPTVSLGGAANVILQTRHINGKAADSDADDGLFLNWATGKPVEVGSDAHAANLTVHGEIGARNFPGDDTTQALAAVALTSRAAGGSTVSWKMYTAGVDGGFGVVPAAYEIWHYDAERGEPRFAIHADGNTYLTPTGGQVFVSGHVLNASDARLKADVEPLDGVLARLAQVRGVSYVDAAAGPGGPRRVGVVAQEVERVFPELVAVSERDGYRAVNYQGLTAVLVGAVNELATEIGRLRARLGEAPA